MTGMASATATGDNDHGVALDRGRHRTTGTGTITITGTATGTGTGGTAYGVVIGGGAVVSAVDGLISVTGHQQFHRHRHRQ